MSNFKSTVNKYGDNKYRVDFSYISPDGKRHRTCKRGFVRQKDAVLWQREEMPKVIKQLEQVEILDENLTMGELISEYMEYSSARRRVTTCGTKEHIIDKKILPYFKDKRVFKVTPWEIEKWQNELLKSTTSSGKEYSATYLRSIRSQLTAIFNYAVRLHNLSSNPMDKVEMIGKKYADERPIWTVEQYKLFRDQIADKPIYYYAFEVLFWCGLRMGEMLALTTADIDFENLTLKVNKSFQHIGGKDILTPPKTESGKRTVHLPKYLADELKEYINTLYEIGENERIFPLSKSGLHHVLANGCEGCGLDKIPVHSLRHSHISLLANMNVPYVVMAERAGHSKSKSITHHYSHSYESSGKTVAEMLNKIMEEMADVSKESGQQTTVA